MTLKLTPELFVTNIEETIAFYEKLVPTKIIISVPQAAPRAWALANIDGCDVMFFTKDCTSPEVKLFAKQRTGQNVILYFDVPDKKTLDAIYAKAKKENAQIIVDRYNTEYGSTEFSIKDNNGYVVSFAKH